MRISVFLLISVFSCLVVSAQQNGNNVDLLSYLPGKLLEYEAQTSVNGESLEEDGNLVLKAERIYEYEAKVLEVSIVQYNDRFIFDTKAQEAELGAQEVFEIQSWRAGLRYSSPDKKATLLIPVKGKYIVKLVIAEVKNGNELKELAEVLEINRLPN